MLLLLAAGVPSVAAQACGSEATEYRLGAAMEEVPETSGSEVELVLSRTGGLTCRVEADIRVLEAELDLKGPLSFTMVLAPGVRTATTYLAVVDDRDPEPREEFLLEGDLHVSGDGRSFDYPGYLSGRLSLQASDAYNGSLQPRIAFADEGRTNRTTVPENGSWYPRFIVSFPPVQDTLVTLQLDNGTCAECRMFGARFRVLANERTVTPLGKLEPEFWAPDDNRSEPPEAACLRISAPGMRVGAPRALVVIDDENRTRAPLANRTLLLRTGLDNATIDHLQDPCGHPVNAPSAATSRPTGSGPGRSVPTAQDTGPGVPSDSPLLRKQESPAPVAAATMLLLAVLAVRRRG